MQTLNALVQIQMMLNPQDAQIQMLSRKTPKIPPLVLADRKLKLREIEEELKISEGSVFIISHEHLSRRKPCSKWVPHLLRVDQEQQRVDDSEGFFNCFKHNKNEVLRKYGTMEETWIQHFPPELNRQSGEWTTAGESAQSDQRHKQLQAKFWPPYVGEALYGWPAKQTIPLSVLARTRQRIFGPWNLAVSGSGKGTKELRGSWRRDSREVRSAEELAWNHGQMRSTPETVAEKIGSSEEDWVKMSAFKLLVEFSLVTHASVSPHMHVVLHTLLLLLVNPKICSCLFVCFIFSCPPDRILVVARNVRYPPSNH